MNIGDKVVCVDDGPCSVCRTPSKLVKGQVYVIRAKSHDTFGDLGIKVIGVENCSGPDSKQLQHNGYFSFRRFRKLDDLKAESKLKASKPIGFTRRAIIVHDN